MDEQFSKWWSEEMGGRWIEHIRSYEMNGDKARCKRAFDAACSLGLAKGRKEGMEEAEKIVKRLRGHDKSYHKYTDGYHDACEEAADAIRQAARGGEGGE